MTTKSSGSASPRKRKSSTSVWKPSRTSTHTSTRDYTLAMWKKPTRRSGCKKSSASSTRSTLLSNHSNSSWRRTQLLWNPCALQQLWSSRRRTRTWKCLLQLSRQIMMSDCLRGKSCLCRREKTTMRSLNNLKVVVSMRTIKQANTMNTCHMREQLSFRISTTCSIYRSCQTRFSIIQALMISRRMLQWRLEMKSLSF